MLPGLHRVNRGAETAFEAVAREMARREDCQVTLFGSGHERPEEPYAFAHVPCVGRERFERWPRVPAFRGSTVYEEFTFAMNLWRRYDPDAFDVTITCSYPWCNWLLRARKRGGRRPAHIFVTQNGDWAPQARNREFRYFGCDGLICTNPEYYERNKDRWPTVLIPNGVDPERFRPGPADRAAFDLPADVPIVLMVSALIPSKRVLEGIDAVSRLDAAHLVVAGDGPLRDEVERRGAARLPGRFNRLSVPRERMPDLYRCADAFLHMSLDEPSANAYIEALATGLPIVTHDRPVTRWTLEACGIYVDATDSPQVADTLRTALADRGPHRTDAQRQLVHNRFTWAGIAGEYYALSAPRSVQPFVSTTARHHPSTAISE